MQTLFTVHVYLYQLGVMTQRIFVFTYLFVLMFYSEHTQIEE